jgi:hypothetical protein
MLGAVLGGCCVHPAAAISTSQVQLPAKQQHSLSFQNVEQLSQNLANNLHMAVAA